MSRSRGPTSSTADREGIPCRWPAPATKEAADRMWGSVYFGGAPFAGSGSLASFLAAVTATISVGTEASLTTRAALQPAPATIAFSTTASLTVQVDLRGKTGITFSTE